MTVAEDGTPAVGAGRLREAVAAIFTAAGCDAEEGARIGGNPWVITGRKPGGYRLRPYSQKFAALGSPHSWLPCPRASAAARGARLS